MESRIQDCLGFPYMGRLIALTKKPIIKPLSIYWMRLRQQPIIMGSWLRMLCGIMQIDEDSADHNSEEAAVSRKMLQI